jgi:hypothetical protein
MFLRRWLVALTLLALPAHAWAIEIAVPCARPSVFSGAAVNVVVLPYSVPPSVRSSSAVGEQLGALVQLETVLSIAKYGSIGVTQLVGDAQDECTPEIVLDKLLGRQGGARETMRPGSGLILIWGRIFESGADLYLQSFVQFLRQARRRPWMSRCATACSKARSRHRRSPVRRERSPSGISKISSGSFALRGCSTRSRTAARDR